MPSKRRERSKWLTLLVDGLFEKPMMNTFLETLRTQTRSAHISLIFRPMRLPMSDLVDIVSGERTPPDLYHWYNTEGHLRDPMPYHLLEDGRVYGARDLPNADDPAVAAFQKDFLTPGGFRHWRIMRVVDANGVNAWLYGGRPKHDYSTAEAAVFGEVAADLRRALRLIGELDREHLRTNVATEALARLNFGWITLDTRGHVVESDANADLLLQRADHIVRKSSGRFTIADRKQDKALHDTIKTYVSGKSSRPRALRVSTEPWVEILLMPINGRKNLATVEAFAIAYVHSDAHGTADREEQMVHLFNLMPSEARLALALGRGLSITEAAEKLGLTVETARNYSKKIYAKMGARGQPDLIRFVLTSVLAIS